jgi:hypothetical protein
MTSLQHHLLIDACVASGLSDPADASLIQALKVVGALQRGSVGLAMTPELRREWMKHASRYMVNFLARMESRRRVSNFSDKRVADFRKAIETHVKQDSARNAIWKDAHLTEAALFYSMAILSLDEKQRKHLRVLADHYPPLRSIQWFNPSHPSDSCHYWATKTPHDRSIGKLVPA